MAGPRDVLIGRIAVERGYLTEGELRDAFAEQDRYRAQGQAVRLTDLLSARNLLTPDQVDELLAEAGPGSGAIQAVAVRRRRSTVYALVGVSCACLLGVLLFLLSDMVPRAGPPAADEESEPGSPAPGDSGTAGPGQAARAGARPAGATGGPVGDGARAAEGARPPSGGRAAGPVEAAAQAALEEAARYAEAHPTDVDGAEARLKAVIENHVTVPAAVAEARARLKEMEGRREQAARPAYETRAAAGERLFEQGEIERALEVFDDFPASLRGTSWYGKVSEWAPGLGARAAEKLRLAAEAAEEFLKQGKSDEALAALESVRPFEAAGAATDAGAVAADAVAGLRAMASRQARGAAQAALAEVVPGLLGELAARRFDGARSLVRGRCGQAPSLAMKDEARLIESDIRGCERLLRVVDAKLRAWAAAGKSVSIALDGGGPRSGTLAERAGALVLRSGDSETSVAVVSLPPREIARIFPENDLDPASRYALGILLLAAGASGEARDVLAPFGGPRARSWRHRAESAVDDAVRASVGPDLEAARTKVGARDWAGGREACERLRQKIGWPADGESGLRREVADLWIRCATELSGLAPLVAGSVQVLPADRVRFLYAFENPGEARDFDVKGAPADAVVSGRALRLPAGAVAWHRFEYPDEVALEFRGMGAAEFGVALAASGAGEDGYRVLFGRAGEILIVREGQVVARGPLWVGAGREFSVRVSRKGGKFLVQLEGRELLRYEDGSPISGAGRRTGFLSGPGGSAFAALVLDGRLEMRALRAAVEAAGKSRKPPNGVVALVKGEALEGWDPMRGEWGVRKGAIWGRGADAFLGHRDLARWEVSDYTFSVEVRKVARRESTPALAFRVGDKSVLWIFGDGGGFLLGLPGADLRGEDLSFKFTPVTIQVRKGRVRGTVGATVAFDAPVASATDAGAGGPLGPFGLSVRRGEAEFRNPVFKAAK